ncbi:hypothetical protein LCGC14_3167470, partial [marine sediment metagenome]
MTISTIPMRKQQYRGFATTLAPPACVS